MTDQNIEFEGINQVQFRTDTEKGVIHDVRYPAVLAVGGTHICIGEYSDPEKAAEVMEIGHITVLQLIVQGII